TCDFEEATTPTEISFLNSAQNGYYDGGVTVQPGQTSVTFTSAVPQGDTQTWLVVRNPAFNGQDKLPLGVRISNLSAKIEDAPKRQVFKPSNLLQDWVNLGLMKTAPLSVKEGNKLTVTCDFDEVTEPTAISFINSAQNGYYEGGITVQPGQKNATFTSVVPQGDTQTWLLLRNPAFNGTTSLTLGIKLKEILLSVEK
ncbi:MAG: hypothetical protein HYX35_02020, partial [Proteobacteria bacterium]|nr:hypothetical protein [Pseudomonadota bacterium]